MNDSKEESGKDNGNGSFYKPGAEDTFAARRRYVSQFSSARISKKDSEEFSSPSKEGEYPSNWL